MTLVCHFPPTLHLLLSTFLTSLGSRLFPPVTQGKQSPPHSENETPPRPASLSHPSLSLVNTVTLGGVEGILSHYRGVFGSQATSTFSNTCAGPLTCPPRRQQVRNARTGEGGITGRGHHRETSQPEGGASGFVSPVVSFNVSS